MWCVQALHFILECLVKLVLEVFGAGGAVWGFSELVYLRTKENSHIWQPVAIGVGVLFFMRWALYIVQHLQHKRLYIYTHKKTTRSIVRKHSKLAKFRAVAKLATHAGHWPAAHPSPIVGANLV